VFDVVKFMGSIYIFLKYFWLSFLVVTWGGSAYAF
jgi:hypothetical protein